MWRSVLLGVVLAGVLAGCNRDGPSGGLTGGGTQPAGSERQTDNAGAPRTTQARMELARIRRRSLAQLPSIGALRCVEKDGVVGCRGTTRDGAAMVAKFQVLADGSLRGAACVGWGGTQTQNEWGYEYQLHKPKLRCSIS
jgi:hypothetical protein